jgi:Tfp pilus assembly protein PilN
MAIKFNQTSEEFEESTLAKIIFGAAIFVFVALIIFYFVFWGLGKNAKNQINSLQQALEQAKSGEELSIEKNVLSYQRKAVALKPLISKHRFSSRFLKELKELIHPAVWISSLNTSLDQGTVSLLGLTDDFLTLSQQQEKFNQSSFFSSSLLSRSTIIEGGKINFDLKLIFDPQKLEGLKNQ